MGGRRRRRLRRRSFELLHKTLSQPVRSIFFKFFFLPPPPRFFIELSRPRATTRSRVHCTIYYDIMYTSCAPHNINRIVLQNSSSVKLFLTNYTIGRSFDSNHKNTSIPSQKPKSPSIPLVLSRFPFSKISGRHADIVRLMISSFFVTFSSG